MSDPAGYSPLRRLHDIQIPWQLVDKNACRRLALLIGKSVFIALLYYLLVVISMKLRFSMSGLSLLWPPNALLVATLALSPKNSWWAYLLAVIPAHIAGMSSYPVGIPGMSSYQVGLLWLAFQVVVNYALTTTCAAILQRFRPEIFYFETLKNVLIFLAVSIAVPGLISLVAVYPVVKFSSNAILLGPLGSVITVWIRGWLNITASFLAFVPTILICATRGNSWFRGLSRRRVGEGVLLTVILIMVALLAYGYVHMLGNLQQALYLIPIPLLIWAAVRFGPVGASLSVTALVCISSWCAYAGEGPFLRSSSIDRVTSMQISWIMVGAPVLALAAVVRERKFATLAFLKSEGRFRQFFETQPESCYMISPEDIVLDVNPAACEALGYTKEELIGKAVSIVYAPESHSKMRDLLEKWKKTGRLESEEMVVLTRDGERRVVLVSAGSAVDAEGNLLHRTSVHVDITERKRAEEALAGMSRKLLETQEQERTRIGRELHDDVNQRLALLSVEIQRVREVSPVTYGELRSRMDELGKRTSEISAVVQSLSHELHSSKLEYLGLVSAMKSFCKEFGGKHQVEIDFSSEGIPSDVPPEVSLCLFRVMQEGLQNALKHSGVKLFDVKLLGLPTEIRLTVRDFGKGFDPELAKDSPGLGLVSMQERVRLVKGTISITSRSQSGTEINVRVPLQAGMQMEQAKLAGA